MLVGLEWEYLKHTEVRGLEAGLFIRRWRRQNRGIERVELSVYASNFTAIHLYEKFNFKLGGQKKKARKLDGSYDDLIVMGLVFEKAGS